jgi:hypothetical protein
MFVAYARSTLMGHVRRANIRAMIANYVSAVPNSMATRSLLTTPDSIWDVWA